MSRAWHSRVLPCLRVFTFLVTFSLEVRVKADVLATEPKDCWAAAASACAVSTAAGAFHTELKLGEAVLRLDEKTALVRVSQYEFRLLSGQVWLRVAPGAAASVGLKSEFGNFSFPAGSEVWVARTASRVTTSVMRGAAQMTPRGQNQVLEIPEGLENWLARVGAAGEARVGVPVAVDFKNHLLRWARVFTGPKAEFEKEAKEFYERWTVATAEVAELHHQLYVRKVASLDSQARRRSEERRRQEETNRRLRELFRERLAE